MRLLKRLAGVAAVLAVVGVVAAYVALTALDAGDYRDRIEARVERATGRDLHLTGPLELSLGLSPALTAEGVRFANADWGSRPDLARIRRFDLEVALWPLLTGELRITRLVLVEPRILLEVGPNGRGNWVLDAGAAGQDGARGVPGLPSVTGVRIENGHLTYRDAESGVTLDLTLEDATLDHTGDRRLAVDAKGAYRTVPFEMTGTVGRLPRLLGGGRYPLDLTAQAAGARITVAGALEQTAGDIRPDVQLALGAERLDALGPLVGAELPAAGPVAVETRVRAEPGAGYRLTDLKAEIAGSALTGRATVAMDRSPARVTADLKAERLDLARLGASAAGSADGDGRLFPDTPLPLSALGRLNGRLAVRAKTVVLPGGLTARDVDLRAQLAQGRLELAPLTAQAAGGALRLTGTVDAAAAPAELAALLEVSELDYGRLANALAVPGEIVGTADLRADVTGRGDSPRALAASLNGRIELVGGQGRFASATLDAVGAGLGDLLAPWRENASEMNLNCAIGRLQVTDGVAESRALLADTDKVTFGGTGSVDLGAEELSLRVTPKAKQASLSSLAVPVRVFGPIAAPKVGPDPLGAAKAAAIVAGAVINPLATLGALALRSETRDQNPCVAALDEARAAPEGTAGDGAAPDRQKGGVKGFLHDLSDSIDRSLGVKPGD
jgi:hypothetical protein